MCCKAVHVLVIYCHRSKSGIILKGIAVVKFSTVPQTYVKNFLHMPSTRSKQKLAQLHKRHLTKKKSDLTVAMVMSVATVICGFSLVIYLAFMQRF